MARTLGCADVGYDCAYRVTTADGEDDFILDTTIAHARQQHPELLVDEAALRQHLRDQIRSLLDQSDYHAQAAEKKA